MLNPTEALWSDVELAVALRMNVRTVANRYSAGKPMPPYIEQPGARKRLYIPASVVAWLSAHEVASKVHRRRGRPSKKVVVPPVA